MDRYFDISYELDPAAALRRIDLQVLSGEPGYVCVADGNILQMVHRDTAYREVVDGAMFSICDSSWVPLFLHRLYGTDVPQYCGSDIFADITAMRRYRQCFLGTSQATLGSLRTKLARVDPEIAGMTFRELPFCSVDCFDYAAIAAEVNADGADIVWVALGAPKQEIFMSRLKPLLKRGVMVGVGAVFNFRAGTGERRAPQWMIRSHLEFMYRIFQNPGKQLRRCWKIVSAYPAIYIREKRRKNGRF